MYVPSIMGKGVGEKRYCFVLVDLHILMHVLLFEHTVKQHYIYNPPPAHTTQSFFWKLK